MASVNGSRGGVDGSRPAVAAAEDELQQLQHDNNQHMEDPDEEMEVMNIEDAEENGYGKGNVEGDVFPFSELPKDIARGIFKKLNAKDRLKARVNWDLYEMEAGEKYELDTLSIEDPANPYYEDDATFENVKQVKMLLTKDCQTYVDALEKLTENTSIDCVHFKIWRREYGPLLSVVSRIPCSKLFICIENDEVRDSLLTEECVKEFPDLLRRLFERMGSAGDVLNYCEFPVVFDPVVFEFLYSIGLIYHNGRFFTTNREIEVYEHHYVGEIMDYNIVIGNRMIYVNNSSLLKDILEDGVPIILERIDEDEKEMWREGMNRVIYLDEEEEDAEE